jgi:hypothetical protein
MGSDAEREFDTSSRPDSAYMMSGTKSRENDGKASPIDLPSDSPSGEAAPLIEHGERTHNKRAFQTAS